MARNNPLPKNRRQCFDKIIQNIPSNILLLLFITLLTKENLLQLYNSSPMQYSQDIHVATTIAPNYF
jgi:hypothetical protein